MRLRAGRRAMVVLLEPQERPRIIRFGAVFVFGARSLRWHARDGTRTSSRPPSSRCGFACVMFVGGSQRRAHRCGDRVGVGAHREHALLSTSCRLFMAVVGTCDGALANEACRRSERRCRCRESDAALVRAEPAQELAPKRAPPTRTCRAAPSRELRELGPQPARRHLVRHNRTHAPGTEGTGGVDRSPAIQVRRCARCPGGVEVERRIRGRLGRRVEPQSDCWRTAASPRCLAGGSTGRPWTESGPRTRRSAEHSKVSLVARLEGSVPSSMGCQPVSGATAPETNRATKPVPGVAAQCFPRFPIIHLSVYRKWFYRL